MMKKMLCIILALVMLLGIMPVSATENASASAVGGAAGGSSGGGGGGVAVGEGYTISGQIVLGEDAILENGMLMGWVCAYPYQGELIDMELLGESEFSTFFEEETDSFDYQLTVPKTAGEIVIAVRPRAEANGMGAFRNNILSDFVYYGDAASSLDYTEASVIPVTGNRSGVDIRLSTGVGFSWQGKIPQESSSYSEYTTLWVEDKATGEVIAETNTHIDQWNSWENMVLPKEYLGKEIYLSYDLTYSDEVLYTEPLYINPDGTCVKTKEEATAHTLTGANAVSFTAGTKTEFTTGIKGKITFEEGCVLNGYFSCTIIAENVETGYKAYAYVNKQGLGEYSYVLPLTEEGTYRVWATINCYDDNSTVSECEHYYGTDGMVYHPDDAEIIDVAEKNTGIDFEFKKTKTLKGRIVTDGELVTPENWKPEFRMDGKNGGFWTNVTIQEDLTFEVKLPVNIQGDCTAYLRINEGSNIPPDYYYYSDEENDDKFDPDSGEVIPFYLETGDLIQGKIKLPEGVDTIYQKSFTISLATRDASGYVNTQQNVQVSVPAGETEGTFLFAVPKGTQTKYILYGTAGSSSGLYPDKFYYTGTKKSSLQEEDAVTVTGGEDDIVLYAMKGISLPFTITNPTDGAYANGQCVIQVGDAETYRYFYLDPGQNNSGTMVLSEDHLGTEAYVYYRLNEYYNIYIYVNPDGTVTNNKSKAVPHVITEDTAFQVTIRRDESLFTIPSIKGKLSLSETAYVTNSRGEELPINGTVYLYRAGYGYGHESQSITIEKGKPAEFEFEPDEIGDYTLAVFLDGWGYQTNLICNQHLYYTEDGWTPNEEDAEIINNGSEKIIEVSLPERPALSGTVDFAEETYLDEEIPYEITYTSVETGASTTKSGYISNAQDFTYKTVGIEDVEAYYVSVRFGSYYGDYDTNIPYGTTYYYTENGLTTDETAVRKAVSATESVILKMPAVPTIRGTITFPEGTEFSGEARVHLSVYNENNSRVADKDYDIDRAEDFPFAIAVQGDGEQFSVCVTFREDDSETNLESGSLYYTKEGMTGNANAKVYYDLEDLADIRLDLRQKRYVTGKLIAEDFVNYDDTLTARVEFQTDVMWSYYQVEFDQDLNYKLEIPSNVDGEFYLGFAFYEEGKNSIVKDKFYYYTDANGEKKKISHPNCENVNIEAATGYIFSGTVKLPDNAVIYEDQTISGSVYLGYDYYSAYEIPYGKREGEFFMVVPKTGYTGLFYTSNGNQYKGKSENLYLGQVYYKDKTTSVALEENAERIRVDKTITDGVIMLMTGEVYKVRFTKPASVTTAEQISLSAEIGEEKLTNSVNLNTTADASVVVPGDYEGEPLYLYYELDNEQDNGLYREKVYINNDGSLTGSKSLAKTFEVGTEPEEIPVTLVSNEDLTFANYLYRSPYPYKDNQENQFRYEYTEGDCDYLKVTFAEETYFAYQSYSRRDSLSITYGDGQTMGPYYTDALAGKTLNIPGNSFTAYINQNADISAFGLAIETIEPKKYVLETAHPYTSATETVYTYTHSTQAEGLRLYFSEETDFSGSMKITYTQSGATKELYKSDYNLAGNTVDVRGNSFTITMPKSTGSSYSYYGFSVVDIEELDYADVTFVNYDGTVLYQTDVIKGQNVSYYGDTPQRERDEDYIYTFDGWDKLLDNIREDTVFTAQFIENPYATVEFKNSPDDEEALYTDYVILGENAYYGGEIQPSKASAGTKTYLFTGWSGSLNNIKEDKVLTAVFEECDILLQSAHPYGEETQSYTYEGSGDSIKLFFSSDSKIGRYDELIIYDEEDRAQHYLSGNLANLEITVPGKTAKLYLSGNQEGDFGYVLAKVVPMWHRFSQWYSYPDATCENEGYEYRWCSNCDTEEERTVPALGHSYGVWQEDTDGTVFKECSRCHGREIYQGDTKNLGMVNVTVVDAVTTKPIQNATLTSYDEEGNETVWQTNKEGVASQMLSRGIHNLVVFAQGYGMRNFSIDVTAGVTNLPVIGLTERPAVECKLEATLMDMEEIKAAGIDVTDPLNSQVYRYRIDIGFGEREVYFNKEGKYIKRKDGLVIRNDETGETATIHPVNDKYYLIIYGQAKWMKEMFDVELVAVNTSATDRVENLTAELLVPDGMSLAAMNTVPQSDVQQMGSLATGESKSVHWYLRGDRAGEYHISAKLTGTLMPFGDQFGYEYTTEEPIKVYAGDALRMNIVIPSVAVYGEDYNVRIEIENVSDRSVYNLSNSIDKILQSKFLMVGQDGYEKYFEENALGYVAVDELKPGEKIVAELSANILFQSDLIKDKISTLADSLKEETDVLAIFNAFKATLDLLNDNYDIIDYAHGNVSRAKDHLTGEELSAAEELETVLDDCKDLVKTGSSSRAMYFINRLKQENTLEELITLSKDANFYTVWSKERIRNLAGEMNLLYEEAQKPENCSDYDIYGDIKKIIKAVPVQFWFEDLFVTALEGSTTRIPHTVTVLPTDRNDIGVTNISNYYYNILTGAIDRLSQPWYTEIMGEVRDPEGVAIANERIKTDVNKSLTFAVTDVSGDTRFHAWVEGENGKRFSVSSSAEGTETTEGGVTFTGPAYLSVSADSTGRGTLYVEKVSETATFSANTDRYSFDIEVVEAHSCASDSWVEIVTAYDDQDGYEAKYCDVCQALMDVRTAGATDDCTSGSYRITEEIVTAEEYSCKLVFDGEIPARSAIAIVMLKDENGVLVDLGKDEIKIKPSSTVQVKVPLKNERNLQPTLFLWDSMNKLRPVGTVAE